MIEKYFIVTSNEVELWINRVRINRSRPVPVSFQFHEVFQKIWQKHRANARSPKETYPEANY